MKESNSLFPEIDREIEEIKRVEAIKIENTLNHIRENSEMWIPSNGTEGMIFEDNFCADCSKDDAQKEINCSLLMRLYNSEKHEDLVLYKFENDSEVICLQDSNFNILDYMKNEEL